eukprot:gene933-10690_t
MALPRGHVLFIACYCHFILAAFTTEKQVTRTKCTFWKSLKDKTCDQPELENGVSVMVDKDRCFAKWKMESIKVRGCKVKKIMNRACKGWCNSIWFPDLEVGKLGCFGCFPRSVELVPLTLICPKRKLKKLKINIPIVKSCKCQSFQCATKLKIWTQKPTA